MKCRAKLSLSFFILALPLLTGCSSLESLLFPTNGTTTAEGDSATADSQNSAGSSNRPLTGNSSGYIDFAPSMPYPTDGDHLIARGDSSYDLSPPAPPDDTVWVYGSGDDRDYAEYAAAWQVHGRLVSLLKQKKLPFGEEEVKSLSSFLRRVEGEVAANCFVQSSGLDYRIRVDREVLLRAADRLLNNYSFSFALSAQEIASLNATLQSELGVIHIDVPIPRRSYITDLARDTG